MEEQRRLLHNQPESMSSEEEEWTDDESDSYYTDSDSSSVPEWESSISDSTGELTFIDCHPFVTQNITELKKTAAEPFSKDPLRRSTRSKFLRLIRRRESKRHRHAKAPLQMDATNKNAYNKVKFHDAQEGEEREVTLHIKPARHYKKQCNLAAITLGINLEPLSDGNRLMVAGFPSESIARNEKHIKIGDWLKSINNIAVTTHNIHSVLEQLNHSALEQSNHSALEPSNHSGLEQSNHSALEPSNHSVLEPSNHSVLEPLNRSVLQPLNHSVLEPLNHSVLSTVHLKLQRVAGVEVTKDPPINELNNQSHFVHQFVTNHKEHTSARHLSVLYLNPRNLTETSSGLEDVIYSFPKDLSASILCRSKGVFITLNQLMGDITKSPPGSSTISTETQQLHVVYANVDGNLLLLMVPERLATLKEALLIHKDIVRMLTFLYESLDHCFGRNAQVLDNFFCRCFTRLANNGVWTTCEQSTQLQHCRQIQFEHILPAVPALKLSNEAQMQIDDALTELEASDYRDWNEDPLDCQRLFTIIGSALYHCGYLVASHFMCEDLVDVHSYCRLQGLFHLSQTEPIKTLLLWRPVFPYSCSSVRNKGSIKAPKGRRYLLIVGSGKGLLAVIMEAGGCTEPSEPNMGPDAFYVEEVQATLAHIQALGLAELADRVLATNPGVQVTLPENSRNGRKQRTTDATEIGRIRDQKVTSILKRRNSDHIRTPDNAATPATVSLDEDNLDKESDSDNDECTEGSQISTGSFDTMSELRQTLLSSGIDQQQLTAGTENVLFHYVTFDANDAVLLVPPQPTMASKTLALILHNFRKTCHAIHAIFQNTLRFKDLPVQDVAKSIINKSLVAVKEQGAMFECPFIDDSDGKKSRIKYWVVGRLFHMQHPREVYVCYQDSIPQNVIELAFKIDLSTMS